MSEISIASDARSSSAGHMFSEVDWLDAHFTWMRPEYEEMLRWVGLQSGWHVLDAACGPGSFLPLMCELVGQTGRIDVIDIAPENVAAVEKRIATEKWQASVFTKVGNILALPYEPDSFDAIWCANTTQYLTDEELRTMLSEFRRVVRPGGLIAIKDYDATVQQVQPTNPTLLEHFRDAALQNGSAELKAAYQQLFRVVDLPRWLRDTGLTELRQKPTFMLRMQPLDEIAKAFMTGFFQFHASVASTLGLPEDEITIWQQLADFDSPNHIFKNPDFQYRCVQTVVIGSVSK